MSIWALTPDDFYMGSGSIVVPCKLDIIIFGATGFMGAYVVAEAMHMLGNYRWGVAGRDLFKLEAMLEVLTEVSGVNVTQTPTFVADIGNPKSLASMVRRCRVLVNCVGSYEKLGPTVVCACIEAGTSYVDLSMEVGFLEKMQLNYNSDARECGSYIVPGCGWHSLPYDLGLALLEDKFDGTLNTVQIYTEYWMATPRLPWPIAHTGLWNGYVLNGTKARKIPNVCKPLYKRPYPKLHPPIVRTCKPFESNVVSGVVLHAPLIDEQVMDRTQYYNYIYFNERPAQIQHYMRFATQGMAIFFMIWRFIIGFLQQLPFLQQLLLRFPRLFTLGFISSKGPCEGVAETTNFRITFKGSGWSTTGNAFYEFKDPPNKTKIVCLEGTNPIYGLGTVCLLASAVTIIDCYRKLPPCGGVYTPGAAFAETGILKYIKKNCRTDFCYVVVK